MKDFKSWEEVQSWLESEDLENVSVESLYFSHTYMSYGEGCCDEHFDAVESTMNRIKHYADGDYTKVNRI